jgi:hypothetical protein
MRKFYYGNHFKTKNVTGSSVAAWLSETVLRGHGPGATGFESHRRGRIFSKEGTMCVHDFQGTVGWWKEEKQTLFRPSPRGRQGSNPGRMGHPWIFCCDRIVCRPKKGKNEWRGWAWVAGESTPEPRRTT